MNTPGTKISTRLAKVGLALVIGVPAGFFILPHLWPAKASIPEVPVTHFAEPPKPIVAPSLPKLIPQAMQSTPTASPKAQPTPCQPCIEAANEVLQRYLHAIRTGAGADNREEQRNIYEVPQQMVPNAPHNVWVPNAPALQQPHP